MTSKLMLWKNKLSADIFVTPCGVDSDSLRSEARKLFIGYRTVNPGFNDPVNLDLYDLKIKNIDRTTTVNDVKEWIDNAKENKLWLIIVFHKVGESLTNEEDELYNIDVDDFKTVMENVRLSEIQVVTPGQLLSK